MQGMAEAIRIVRALRHRKHASRTGAQDRLRRDPGVILEDGAPVDMAQDNSAARMVEAAHWTPAKPLKKLKTARSARPDWPETISASLNSCSKPAFC